MTDGICCWNTVYHAREAQLKMSLKLQVSTLQR